MIFHPCRIGLVLLAALPGGLAAQGIKVIRSADSPSFQMGDVTSKRIVHPGLGAKKTTLNFSITKPGSEFAQHVHDISYDTILVLQGEVNLRQGSSLRLFQAGECAFVPAGQIHGTVTAGTGEAMMISFQNPPDLLLYTNQRDSSKKGAAPPKGDITPGAVKYMSFRAKNGAFLGPADGAERITASRWKLKRGEKFRTSVDADGEQVLFVFKGAIRLQDKSGVQTAGERDTVFISGAARFQVTGDADGETEVIQVQAPLPSGK